MKQTVHEAENLFIRVLSSTKIKNKEGKVEYALGINPVFEGVIVGSNGLYVGEIYTLTSKHQPAGSLYKFVLRAHVMATKFTAKPKEITCNATQFYNAIYKGLHRGFGVHVVAYDTIPNSGVPININYDHIKIGIQKLIAVRVLDRMKKEVEVDYDEFAPKDDPCDDKVADNNVCNEEPIEEPIESEDDSDEKPNRGESSDESE